MLVSKKSTVQPSSLAHKNQIRTILFPTDFSDAAQNAFRYATQMASALSAKLVLLHVYENHMVLAHTAPEDLKQSLQEERISRASEALANFQSKVTDQAREEVEMECLLKGGLPGKAIIECLEEVHPDLIIMGTSGAASVHERILGSVTAYIVQHAQIPVLAIPAEASYKPIRNIQYAMNMEAVDIPAINRLIDICESLGAKLYCTHIKTPKANWTRIQVGAFNDLSELEKLGLLECYIIDNEAIDRGLEEFLMDQNIDCLSMTTHMHDDFLPKFEKSLTRHMLMQTDVPLLTFHA